LTFYRDVFAPQELLDHIVTDSKASSAKR